MTARRRRKKKKKKMVGDTEGKISMARESLMSILLMLMMLFLLFLWRRCWCEGHLWTARMMTAAAMVVCQFSRLLPLPLLLLLMLL